MQTFGCRRITGDLSHMRRGCPRVRQRTFTRFCVDLHRQPATSTSLIAFVSQRTALDQTKIQNPESRICASLCSATKIFASSCHDESFPCRGPHPVCRRSRAHCSSGPIEPGRLVTDVEALLSATAVAESCMGPAVFELRTTTNPRPWNRVSVSPW